MTTKELMKFRITIEVPCDACQGSGERHFCPAGEEPTEENIEKDDCNICHGEGYEKLKTSLLHLKNLLEGGSL